MIRGEEGGRTNKRSNRNATKAHTHTHTFEIGAPRTTYGFKQQDNDSPAVWTPVQKLSALRATMSGVGEETSFRLVRNKGGN